MKELTVKQKAEAYDEAIKRAKRIISVCVDDNTECRSMIACIQQIFPELKEKENYRKPNGGIVLEDFNEGDGFYKVNLAYLSKKQVEEIENIVNKWNIESEESEDERIRKQIISFLKEFERDHYRNLDFSSWITWLEKQGNESIKIDIESMVSSYEQRLKSQGGIGNSLLVNMCLTAFRRGVENILDELAAKKLKHIIKNSMKKTMIVVIIDSCVCISLVVLLMIYLFSDVPTAKDVYQGKTTLEITYRDGVPIDSAVVFKEQLKEK